MVEISTASLTHPTHIPPCRGCSCTRQRWLLCGPVPGVRELTWTKRAADSTLKLELTFPEWNRGPVTHTISVNLCPSLPPCLSVPVFSLAQCTYAEILLYSHWLPDEVQTHRCVTVQPISPAHLSLRSPDPLPSCPTPAHLRGDNPAPHTPMTLHTFSLPRTPVCS